MLVGFIFFLYVIDIKKVMFIYRVFVIMVLMVVVIVVSIFIFIKMSKGMDSYFLGKFIYDLRVELDRWLIYVSYSDLLLLVVWEYGERYYGRDLLKGFDRWWEFVK